jgi:hypothetical protein
MALLMADLHDPRWSRPPDDLSPETVEWLRTMARGNRRFIQILGLLILILLIAVLGGFYAIDRSARVSKENRVAASLENCRGNHAQDNVLRAILAPSVESNDRVSEEEEIRLRHTYERVLRKSPGNKSLRRMRLELVEHLMRPLGGFRTTPEEQREQCVRRLRIAGLPIPPQLQN